MSASPSPHETPKPHFAGKETDSGRFRGASRTHSQRVAQRSLVVGSSDRRRGHPSHQPLRAAQSHIQSLVEPLIHPPPSALTSALHATTVSPCHPVNLSSKVPSSRKSALIHLLT